MLGRHSSPFLALFSLSLSFSLGSIGCSQGEDDRDFGSLFDGSVWPGGAKPDAGTAIDPITGGKPDGSTLPTPDGGFGGLGGLDATVPGVDAGKSDAAAQLDAGDAQVMDAQSTDASDADAAGDGDAPGDTGPADAQSADAQLPDAQTDGGDSGPRPQASCLDGITEYGRAGPFAITTRTVSKVKFWVPSTPPGCKVPVVHLANGTTATCSNYQGALERLASHGFLTACYEDPNTGAGTYGITAFEAAYSTFPELADNKLGSTGHSQGGQAALITTQLAEAKWGASKIYAALAMQPASGYGTQPDGQTWQQSYAKIKAPVFMFSGNSGTGFLNSALIPGIIPGRGDGLVGISWVQEGFDALNDGIEAYHWLADGATHIPTPVPEEQEVSIPWFRWKLLGDNMACRHFKRMTMGSKWRVEKEQNAKPCQ